MPVAAAVTTKVPTIDDVPEPKSALFVVGEPTIVL
jgi:hypothetical protein